MTRHVAVVWFAALLALSWTRAAGIDLGKRALAKEVVQSDPLPVPQVRHFKSPGGAYTKASPMYRLQQAIRDIVSSTQDSYSPLPGITMRCIIALAAQFFLVYTVYFIVQALNRLNFMQAKREREDNYIQGQPQEKEERKGPWQHEEKCMEAVAQTVYFVPMLCFLFMGTRLRAVQITRGKEPALYDIPQWWVKAAMVSCVWSLFAQTLLVLVCAWLYGHKWEELAKNEAAKPWAKICVYLKHFVMFCIYASYTTVCVGICIMQPPVAIWGPDAAPPVSPAVICTIFLSVLYFAVYLAAACARAVNDFGVFGAQTRRFPVSEGLLKGATSQVLFAPMLCALFIAARLRALQLDSFTGNPQEWVQTSFYVCTFSILAMTLLAVVGGALGVPMEDAHDENSLGPQGISADKKAVSFALEAFAFLALACLYTGVVVIMVGLAIMEPSDDSGRNASTGPLPTSLRCVIVLTNLFFFVYCAIWIRNCVSKFVNLSAKGTRVMAVMKTFLEVRAKEAVSFCPMFSVLFLGAFIRALQVTGGKGTPQRWCQWFMCLATWGIFLLTIARVDAVLPDSRRNLSNFCTTVQYICLGVLYVCAVAIVVAMFTMTPQNANGFGSLTPAAS